VREQMNARTPLVDLRTGAKEERKPSQERASVEEDYYWQGMVVPDPAFYLKDNG
jgi:hypothetical protein